jgi:putative ABC transport system substrate-binding protein
MSPGLFYFRALSAVASPLAIEPIGVPVLDEEEIELTCLGLYRDSNAGLVVVSDSFTMAHRESIIALAAKYRIPAVYPARDFVNRGGLISYGIDEDDLFRQSASYVDRLLKGNKPGDLPVQAPTKFELVINLKTAKTLGLSIPPMLLATATEAIE